MLPISKSPFGYNIQKPKVVGNRKSVANLRYGITLKKLSLACGRAGMTVKIFYTTKAQRTQSFSL